MPLEELLRALEVEAGREVREVLADATSRSERLRNDARTDRRRTRELAVAKEESRLRGELGKTLAEARRTAEADVLRAREAALRRVYADAAARLVEAQDADRYRADLPARMEAALAYLPEATAVVLCHPGLCADVRAAVAAREDVAVVEDPDGGAGFRVRVSDGRFEVDERLATRLEQLRKRLDVELVRRIEGKDP